MAWNKLVMVAILTGPCLAAQIAAQTLTKVYVQAGNGGFAANGANDTMLDLRKALGGKARTLRVVDAAAEADVIVRIDSREERKETAGATTYANQSDDGKSATATTVPSTKYVRVLHGTLIAGDFQMPLQDESALSWRLAASDMASDVDHWVKENSAKLIERRLGNERQTQPTAAATPQGPAAATQAPTQADNTSITPGMTELQVEKAMGAPEKKIGFGKKAMWNYRGMQVVFEDGKVVDVKF